MVERSAMSESSERESRTLNSQPSKFNRLCDIVAKLRAPGGCPWDREQTHESLLPQLIEEAYEVAGTVLKQWESIKRAEKTGKHYLDGLPTALPALMRAQKAQSKAARVNFDWTELRDVIAKIEEEVAEARSAISSQDRQAIKDESGDLLFAVVNLARKCKLDAEGALQSATDKFVARFNQLEDELKLRGKKLGDVDLAELDAIWNEIKQTPNAEAF